MCYGLIEITDWIFYFSDETKKKKKRTKNGNKIFWVSPIFASQSAEIKQTSFYFLPHMGYLCGATQMGLTEQLISWHMLDYL